jgi:hypothetical protein
MGHEAQPRRPGKGAPLSDIDRARLKAYLDEYGERATLLHFGISRNALYRALAGMTVLNGTAALVHSGFAAEAPPR